MLTPDGELIERIGAVYGLPAPVSALGLCGAELCLQSSDKTYLADVQQLSWQQTEVAATWSQSQVLPAALHAELTSQSLGSGLDLERVMLDLHSGRLFGNLGVWLVDLAALGLLLLSLSGFWMWYQQARRRR